MVTLRHDMAGATGAEATSLVTTGKSLIAMHNSTFLLGPALMAGLNALFLGWVMYRSRLVPRHQRSQPADAAGHLRAGHRRAR
jgi:hypothetical protein